MATQDFTEISYTIDPQDHLLTVSSEWVDFALKNHGDGLTPEYVKGRSLWDFITDEPTRELYEAVLAHVRSGPTTDLVLRCDAPERRRLIEMTVTLLADGNVEFKTVLLASKPRIAQRLFDRDTPRTARHLMVCSWCDKVSVGVDKWFEVEAAMEYLHLTGEAELPIIEPVVCPECYARVMEIISDSVPLGS
ncbi:MAG: hypothetical protein K8R23_08320 [Chthoniobacter sp.]|nr:hypothetical protein [Chthoniobacter sp.]